jgi:transcriptional regulator with XRE-family HTH domain
MDSWAKKGTLGRALRAARKARNYTQQRLARHIRMSVSVVRNLERGLGRVSNLARVLRKLNLELRGRALKAGPIGPALVTARQQRRLSRRALARALHVSRNTLAVTESGGGLVQTLEAYSGAVGARLYVAPSGAPRPFFVHAGNASGFSEWETPAALATLLTEAVGQFDLDPCAATSDRRAARVKARILLTAADDGLSVPWRGLPPTKHERAIAS